MTPGPFLKMLSEKLGIPYGKVEGVRRVIRRYGGMKNVNRGPAAAHIAPDEAADILVAICANVAGLGYERAAFVATANENGESAELLRAVRERKSYSYWRKRGDLRLAGSISADALIEIFAAAFPVLDAGSPKDSVGIDRG